MSVIISFSPVVFIAVPMANAELSRTVASMSLSVFMSELINGLNVFLLSTCAGNLEKVRVRNRVNSDLI